MNQVGLLGRGTTDGLTNPESGIGPKTTATSSVKFLDCPHQSQVSLLDEIQERDADLAVMTRNRNHQRQIRLDQLLTRPVRALGHVVRQLKFLVRGKAIKATQVLRVAHVVPLAALDVKSAPEQ